MMSLSLSPAPAPSSSTVEITFGVIGNAASIVLFASPGLSTFWEIWVNRAVDEAQSPLPYAAALINCLMWLMYGAVNANSGPLITVNAIGVVVELGYLAIFLYFVDGDRRSTIARNLCYALAVVAVMDAVITLIRLVDAQKGTTVLSIMCLISGSAMYFSLVPDMTVAFQNGDVEHMTIWFALASFFNALCWTVYASIRKDFFIGFPNGLGLVLSACQIAFHGVFTFYTYDQDGHLIRRAGDIIHHHE